MPRLSSVNSGAANSGYKKAAITLTVDSVMSASATLIKFVTSPSLSYIDDGTVITFDANFGGTDNGELNSKSFKLFQNAAADTFEIRTNASPAVAVDTSSKAITKGTATGNFQGFASSITTLNLTQDQI